MGRPVRGDVVVVPFPFSNLAASKKRPALVIAPLDTHDDVILCMITSRSTTDAHAIPVTSADFDAGGLPRDSNVRPNRLFTADARIIARHAGRLSSAKLDAVVAEIIKVIAG
ncbi:MAG: type II toxin-antitoxin system PemK/MazF family toxin [Chloroflexi bacterium CFX6]|nr:type II toxin-antitoxin system PemK/MazF family toxin [Chloroflexi bacterium CFX6]